MVIGTEPRSVYPACHDSVLYHGRQAVLRHTGRAAIEVGEHLHRLCHLLLTLAVVLSVAVLGAAWRLSRGPVDVGFLRDRVEKEIGRASCRERVLRLV